MAALALQDTGIEATPVPTPDVSCDVDFIVSNTASLTDAIDEDEEFDILINDAVLDARRNTVTYHVSNGVTFQTVGTAGVISGVTWGSTDLTNPSVTVTGTISTTATTNSLYLNGDALCGGTSTSITSSSWVPIGSLVGNRYTINADGVVTIYQDGNIICVEESQESKDQRIKNQIKQIMKTNLLIKNNSRHLILGKNVSSQEEKARETLRDLISERDWRRYLTNGFVIVKAPSGKFYQIFNDQRHVKVYQKGVLTAEICIHTHSDTKCPPTDHILNLMFLVQNDESLIWVKDVGNVYKKAIPVSGNIVGNSGIYADMVDAYGDVVNVGGGLVTVPYIGEDGCKTLIENYRKLKAA